MGKKREARKKNNNEAKEAKGRKKTAPHDDWDVPGSFGAPAKLRRLDDGEKII